MGGFRVGRESGPRREPFGRPGGPTFRRHPFLEPVGPTLTHLIAHPVASLCAHLLGKASCPLADEQNMRQFLHDTARHADGMKKAAQSPYRTRAQSTPVHDAGIQLHLPQQVGPRILANAVHIRRGLHQTDACLDSVHRVTAGFQDTDRLLNAGLGSDASKNDHIGPPRVSIA